MPTAATTTYGAGRLEPFMDPENARMVSVQLSASQTLAAGTVLGEVTASPGVFKAYASGSADGSQTARLLLCYPVVVDASGNITISSTAAQAGSDIGTTSKSTPAYYSGTFATVDLTGLDAGAATALGKLVQGTVSAGILRIG